MKDTTSVESPKCTSTNKSTNSSTTLSVPATMSGTRVRTFSSNSIVFCTYFVKRSNYKTFLDGYFEMSNLGSKTEALRNGETL